MLLLRLIERNLKLYYRDKIGVFFSFLAVIMIIVMYAVFLGQNHIDSLKNSVGDIPGVEGLIIAWVMAGILCVSTITVPLSALGVLVEDRQNGQIGDFYTAPINRQFLVLSYFISASIITVIMGIFNLIVGQIYLAIIGAPMLGAGSFALILLLILLSSLVFSIFFFYLAISIRSIKAFGSLGTIIGTLVGFFGGIYIPIGVLNPGIQTIVNVIPVAHSVTLFRRIYMTPYLTKVFAGAPADILDGYRAFNGYEIFYGNFQLESWHMLLVLFVFGIIFYALSVIKIKKAHL